MMNNKLLVRPQTTRSWNVTQSWSDCSVSMASGSITWDTICSSFFTSRSRKTLFSPFFRAVWDSLDLFLRFGESLRVWTWPLLSPTNITGSVPLKAMWLRTPSFRVITVCKHRAVYKKERQAFLLMLRLDIVYKCELMHMQIHVLKVHTHTRA